MQIKLALITSGGELDSKIVEVPDDYELTDRSAVTTALLDWLNDDCHVLDAGDTLSITELEPGA